MSDKRSKRRVKVIPFVTIRDDRKINLSDLVSLAKSLQLEGFEEAAWEDQFWSITGGRLVNLTGKNSKKASIEFKLSPKLGEEPLVDEWSELAKALFVLRFHQKNQAIPNQRNFITSIGYVAYSARKLNLSLFQLTPEALDNACELISSHYASSTAYNLHKAVGEFAAHCDANGLCRIFFNYKYSGMKRPENTGGLKDKRLDDPNALAPTKAEQMVEPVVYQVIGELYQQLPNDHKYRLYVLILSLLLLTGRRLSEILLMPFQTVQEDKDGYPYLDYFPQKSSLGDVYTPKERLYLPSEVAPIAKEIIEEVVKLTDPVRKTARAMQANQGPDLGFLNGISEDKRLFSADLERLGLSKHLMQSNGWLRKNNHVGTCLIGNRKMFYINKEGIAKYCTHYFEPKSLEPYHIDQQGKKYYLSDLLFIRNLGLSSGAYAHWLATSCSHAMLAMFLKYFPDLAREYASQEIDVDFNSHHFRHTMNTLLDEGGLSDLLQTEWFGRKNSRDTKAYQHTSPAKRALMLREDIKQGNANGVLADQLNLIPIEHQDAVLEARIKAVHDVGTGLCIHNFSQMPCERHLQCSAECKDYVWIKDDSERIEEVKRLYAITTLAQETAENKMESNKPKKSSDWIMHNNKKLRTLKKQLSDYGVEKFDPAEYLKGVNNV